MKVITIGILCVGFLAVNFLLRKALATVRRKSGLLGIINRYFPIIELVFWASFVIWVVDIMFSTSQFFLYFIFLMITFGFVLFFLFFVKDYIAGIQLKSRYNLYHSQRFKSSQVSGIIKKLGLLSIELKSDNGSDFKVPYAQIDQKTIELNIQEKSGGENIIKVNVASNLNEEATVRKISELVINSPWSSHKSNPTIVGSDVENGQKTYKISCITNGVNGGKKLKELVEKEFNNQKKQ